MKNRPWIRTRKALLRKARRRFPEQGMEWVGGILYFSKNLQPVPGVRHVPKPHRPTLGLRALDGGEASA